jgi:hypothetical protein
VTTLAGKPTTTKKLKNAMEKAEVNPGSEAATALQESLPGEEVMAAMLFIVPVSLIHMIYYKGWLSGK